MQKKKKEEKIVIAGQGIDDVDASWRTWELQFAR